MGGSAVNIRFVAVARHATTMVTTRLDRSDRSVDILLGVAAQREPRGIRREVSAPLRSRGGRPELAAGNDASWRAGAAVVSLRARPARRRSHRTTSSGAAATA